jgi:hypothetical protein
VWAMTAARGGAMRSCAWKRRRRESKSLMGRAGLIGLLAGVRVKSLRRKPTMSFKPEKKRGRVPFHARHEWDCSFPYSIFLSAWMRSAGTPIR